MVSQFIEMFGDPETNSKGLPVATLPDLGENLDSKRIPITGGNRKTGEYPYYGASGIVDYVADYIFDDDLLLISEDGANLVARVTPIAFSTKGKVWINNHAHVIKFKNMAMQCYVENLINMMDISQYVTGTAQPKLNQAKLNSIPIPVPEEDEIKQYLNFVQQSDKSKFIDFKSQFIEMFGDPVANPNRHPVKRLAELGELNRGVSKSRPRNKPELLGGPYPLVQTGEVTAAELYITSYENTYSELGLAQSKMWPKGTLCITIAANIAQTAILGFDSCFPDSVVGFIPGKEVTQIYIHYWFGFFQKILEEQAPQVAQKNINLKILSGLQVIVPSMDLQEQFVDFVRQSDKSK